MYLEQAGEGQIKIYISLEELEKHGVTQEEVGKDSQKWHHLLENLILQVCEELDLTLDGMVTIDVFSFQRKEVVFLLTLYNPWEAYGLNQNKESSWEIKSMNGKKEYELFYAFRDIEDVIQFSQRIEPWIVDGKLYYLDQRYYLHLKVPMDRRYEKIKNIISEYANQPTKTLEYVQEYGKQVFSSQALEQLNRYFPRFPSSRTIFQ